MSGANERFLVWIGGLLLFTLFGLAFSSGFSFAGSSVLQDDTPTPGWGSPCPLPHPTTCFVGTSVPPLNPMDAVGSQGAALAPTPIAVELICFSGKGMDQQVELEWQTATELNTAGFFVLRSLDEQGQYDVVSDFIVHCDDGGLVGGYYLFEDAGLTNEQTYYYQLAEVISAQETVVFGPVPVIPSNATPTPSPSLTLAPSRTPAATPSPSSTSSGSSGTQSPSPTSTLTPGSGASPTSTASPSASPLPTRTPPIGSTFTPTFAPSATASVRPATNTPLPTATRRVTSTAVSGDDTIGNPGPSPTPEELAQVNTPISGYPPPEQDDLAMPTGYPPPVELPSATPFPADYVPPPTARPYQLATMTPSLPAPLPLATNQEVPVTEDSSPRNWLCAGFMVSMLALCAVVAILLRRQQPQRPSVASGTIWNSGSNENALPVTEGPSGPVSNGSEGQPLDIEGSGLPEAQPGEADSPNSTVE